MSAPDAGVAWLPWGEEAFALARATGRPIALHIGATWCHWCHVMDEDSYTFPGVAALLSAHFVAIRVDTDERPDVNERYNQGGWPTFAILDHQGEVLMGRTYVPGPELRSLLTGLATSEQRWTIAPSTPAITQGPPTDIAELWTAVERAYDRYHGGFGDLEKFPHVQLCEWLLDRAQLAASPGAPGGDPAATMLVRTLDAMAGLGMYDREEGGFFRYSTQDDWSVPHFEKMLEDHARLLALYLRAAAWRPSPLWDGAVDASVRWCLATLWQDEAAGFGGSQDADEAYYALPRSRRGTPPPVDRTIYTGWNGWMIAALVRAWAARGRPGLLGIARRAAARLVRDRLAPDGCVTRTGAVRGLLEDQVGLADGLLAVGAALGENSWIDAAAQCLTWVGDHLSCPDGGYYDRIPGGPGRLSQPGRPLPGNAALASTALHLFALTGSAHWRTMAESAATAALVEAAPWGFMGAPAGRSGERVRRAVVTVKVRGNDAVLRHFLAHRDANVYALAVKEGAVQAGDGDRQAVPEGLALACTPDACGRPSADIAALEATIRQLQAGARRG